MIGREARVGQPLDHGRSRVHGAAGARQAHLPIRQADRKRRSGTDRLTARSTWLKPALWKCATPASPGGRRPRASGSSSMAQYSHPDGYVTTCPWFTRRRRHLRATPKPERSASALSGVRKPARSWRGGLRSEPWRARGNTMDETESARGVALRWLAHSNRSGCAGEIEVELIRRWVAGARAG